MKSLPRQTLARGIRFAIITWLALIGDLRSAEPGSWPAWRGPTGQGIAAGVKLPAVWPDAPLEDVWKAPLASGWSSPVVADGRVFVTDREQGTERVLAFDVTSGRSLWQATNPVDFDPHAVGRAHGNGPKSTPIVNRSKVYSLGIAGWLQCVDAATGKRLWHINLPAEFGEPVSLPLGRSRVYGDEYVVVPIGQGQGAAVPLFGYTGSLALDGDLLICPVGQPKAGTIVAFDANTGRVVWKALDEHVSYSSPIVATVAGKRQVVVMTGPRVVGLDLADGRLLWSYPFQIQYDESIATPSVAGDMVVVTAYGEPLTALRISANGADQKAEVAWRNDDLSCYLSSTIIVDDSIYGSNDAGEASCVRLADGETLWTGTSSGSYCTPVWADGKLLCLNENGKLLVIAADPREFRRLGQSQVAGNATWTAPALVDGFLFVRSRDGLRCIKLPSAM